MGTSIQWYKLCVCIAMLHFRKCEAAVDFHVVRRARVTNYTTLIILSPSCNVLLQYTVSNYKLIKLN